MHMDEHFGLCICVYIVFLLCRSFALLWGVEILNKCLCLCGTRLEVFEICLGVEHWGCKFVWVWSLGDVNLLYVHGMM